MQRFVQKYFLNLLSIFYCFKAVSQIWVVYFVCTFYT